MPLFLVSNRLPVSIDKRRGQIQFTPSAGGLATGMSGFHQQEKSLWVGWPGIASEKISQQEQRRIEQRLLSEHRCQPVFLSQRDIDLHYYGFSNATLWPLFHYFPQFAAFNKQEWSGYRRINEQFRDALLPIVAMDDTVWIHDYHLLLLPELLREKMPGLSIGFFLHIPFPSFEILRMLPWRAEILQGMLGADVIGFHTYEYVLHFLQSTQRFLGLENEFGRITLEQRIVSVDAFPMGIDAEKFSSAAGNSSVMDATKRLRHRGIGKRKVILSIDRLDYTKGIAERLKAFELLLKNHPGHRENVVLMLIVVPSRSRVEHYRLMKRELDELVGTINGQYGTLDWTPIQYLYQAQPFPILAALYGLADIALVTPLRDGMNLIAKEYVASRSDSGGVLILSERTGASKELTDALIVNPSYIESISNALLEALTMSHEEQKRRMEAMQWSLRRRNTAWWARSFRSKLADSRAVQNTIAATLLTADAKREIREHFTKAKRRLLLLDYDGTLVPIARMPRQAVPSEWLLQLLSALARLPATDVVLISGRQRQDVDRWFTGIPIGFVAEHGAWWKKHGGQWAALEQGDGQWKEHIRSLLESFVDTTPGSFIEEKDFSLAWHYRMVDPELRAVRVPELLSVLPTLLHNLPLQVREGKRVVEVKRSGIDKGRSAQQWTGSVHYDFILAAGDDATDEDLFQALPHDAYTIKVGTEQSKARLRIASPADVVGLLQQLKASLRMPSADARWRHSLKKQRQKSRKGTLENRRLFV